MPPRDRRLSSYMQDACIGGSRNSPPATARMAYRKTCGRCLAEAKRTTRSSRNSERSGWLGKRVGSFGERVAEVAKRGFSTANPPGKASTTATLPASTSKVSSRTSTQIKSPIFTSTGVPPSSSQSRRTFPSAVVQRRRAFRPSLTGFTDSGATRPSVRTET